MFIYQICDLMQSNDNNNNCVLEHHRCNLFYRRCHHHRFSHSSFFCWTLLSIEMVFKSWYRFPLRHEQRHRKKIKLESNKKHQKSPHIAVCQPFDTRLYHLTCNDSFQIFFRFRLYSSNSVEQTEIKKEQIKRSNLFTTTA